MTRAGALKLVAVVAVAALGGLLAGRCLAPGRTPRAPSATPTAVPVVGPEVHWMIDLGPRAAVPDRVVHPPIVLGDRVIVAGARVGYAALDRATGAVAWRRGAGPELAPPLALGPRDLLLVHDCDAPVAIPDRVVVGCFDRIDPIDIAARSAGAIHVAPDDAAPCLATMAPWRLTASADGPRLERPGCALVLALDTGAARAVAPTPELPAPTCDRLPDGTAWCQEVGGGQSTVVVGPLRVPGLSLLAAAYDGRRTALVVRADATLRHDVVIAVAGGEVAWTWPLPEPVEARATPVAVAVIGDAIYVVFDSGRVAALAAP